jgi:hypothetical protein
MLVSSKHEILEGSQLKTQQSQQHDVSRVTAEEIFHHGSKGKLMASEVLEISYVDGIKYKTSHNGSVSNNKGQDTVTESASVEKTSKGLSKHLASKEKCRKNQIVPYNSFAGEVKKYQKNVPKYSGGVRRTSPQYYMTISEYFGKNFIKEGSKTEHNAKDSAKNLTKNECRNNNLRQLVYENKFPVISTNLEKSDKVTKTKNTSTKTVILPAELKQKLVDVSDSQHRSKSLKRVKRRSSNPCDLLSKTHKKRRYSYGGEEAAVFGMSVEKGSKIRFVGNEKKTKKNEDKILEIPEPLETEQAAAHGLSIENATETKPGGNETLKTTMNEKKLLGKESEFCSETECVAIQGLSAANATKKTKPEGSEIVKTGKNEEKIFKEKAMCWKPEQQSAAKVLSIEKATKIKPGGSEVVKTRNNEKKILETEYAQCLKTEEQAAAQVVSIQKMTKMKPGGSEVVKIRKNDEKIVKKESLHLKGEEQAVAQGESIQKTLEMKPRVSWMVKIRKNVMEMLLKENQHSSIVDTQATAYGDLIKETPHKNASKAKSGGNEMIKATKSCAKALRKERQHRLFENGHERNQHGTSLQKKQNKINSVEDITNRSPSHGPKFDSKFSKKKKKKKKKEIMLELFGEDSDEPSRENSNHPYGVGFKVLQESNACAVSAKVSDPVEVNAAFATPFELNHKEKDNRSRDSQPNAFSCNIESEMKRFIKGTGRQNDYQKMKEFGGNQSSPLSHKSEVKNACSQKLVQLIDSVEQSNQHQGNLGSSITDGKSVHAIQQNEDQSSLTSHKNDLHIAATETVVACADTLGENDHQKDAEPGGYYETELPVTCSMKDGIVADTVAQNNGLKHDELQSEVKTHESDIHLTGSIKEGKNGEFHLVINMGNTDTLFTSSQKDHSGSAMQQISVNYNVAEGTNDASDGHSADIKGVASAEKCTENPNVLLDTGESVEENVNVSVSDNAEVSTLRREATECAEKHVQPVSDEVCAKQNEPGNQHLTVERLSRSEPPQDLVLLSKESVQDSVSQSQNVSLSATLTKQTEVEIAEIHAETASSQILCDERSKEIEVKETETDRIIAHGKDIQKECDAGGKEKCVPESDCVLNVDCNKGSDNFPRSIVNSNESQSSATTVQTSISNSGKFSALNGAKPSVISEVPPKEQLGHNLTTNPSQSESVLSDSRSTNDIPHVADAPVSQTLPRIRVRDPESLGITRPQSSFFEVTDKRLSDLTQFTYVLMQDMIRINERHKALSPLTGSLRYAETALVKAEWMSTHMTYKAIACLNLYKCVERIFPSQIEEFLIRRLNELNPSRTYTSEELKRCLNYCRIIRNQNSSVPYPHQHQQQPVAVPVTNNVTWNKNNQILSLSQAGGQISNSGANINSTHQTSESVPVTRIHYTAGRKEIGTHTSGSLTNAPPPYDMHTREAGTNFSARHSQIGNIHQQQFAIYNPIQTPNSSSQQCHTYSNSAPHMPVSATDGPIPPVQGQVYNDPSKNRTVPVILQRTHGAQNTTQSAFQNLTAYHGSNNVGVEFTGRVPVSGSSYSQPKSFVHPYPPSQQGAPSHNSSSSMYPQSQAIQQGTLLHHSSNDNLQNRSLSRVIYASNQGTQQGMFPHVMSKNAVLNKSAPKTTSQPYHRNEPVQRGTFSQSVSNVLPNMSNRNSSGQPYPSSAIQQGTFSHRVSDTLPNISAPISSSQSYPRNETMQKGTYSQPVNSIPPNMPTPNSSSQLYPPSAIQQGTFSNHLKNVALQNTTCSYNHQYLRNKAVHTGMFSHHMVNDIPSQENTLLHGLLSAPNSGPGHVHQARNNLYPPPPPYGALPSSLAHLKQMTLRAQQQVSAQEYHAPASQENTGYYSRRSFPQQSQALAVGSGSELQLHGTPQSIILRQSGGRRNAENSASNSLNYGGNSQNVPARNDLFDRGNNWDGSFGNGTARNSQSDTGNSQNESPANSTASNDLSYWRKTQGGQASSSLSDRETTRAVNSTLPNMPTSNSSSQLYPRSAIPLANIVVNNNLCDRGNNPSGSLANSTASNSLSGGRNTQNGSASNIVSDGGNYKRISLANTTASNSLSDEGNNLSGTLADRGNNQSQSLAHNTSNSLPGRGNNQSGSLANTTANNSLSDRGNNQSGFLANNAASIRVSGKEHNQIGSLTNNTASKSLSDRGNSQNGSVTNTTASKSLYDRGNSQIGSLTNTAASNLSDRGNSQSGSLTDTAASKSLSDRGNSQIGSLTNTAASNLFDRGFFANTTASNSLSDKENNQIESLTNTASKSLSDRGNNQSGSLTNTAASKSLSDRGNNQIDSVTNTTGSNLSDTGNNQSRYLTNTTASNHFSDRGNSQSGSLTNSTTSNSLSGGRNNQSDCLANCMASNSLPDRGNNQSGPPPLIDIPTSVSIQTRLNGVHTQLNKSTENLPISEVVQQNMNNITQSHFSEEATYTSTESHGVNRRNVFNVVCAVSEATTLGDSHSESNSDITESSASLQNSQTLLHGDKQSSLYRNQQRQLSNGMTTDQPEVSNSTLVAVQASGSQNHASGVLIQSAGTLPTTSQSVQLSVYQPFDAHRRTDSGTVGEIPEKTLSDSHSTPNTLSIEAVQNASDKTTLQTCRRQSSKHKPRNHPGRAEVVGSRNDMLVEVESKGLGTEVGDSEDIQIVTDIGGKQNKCDISNRMLEKHSTCHNYSPDPKTGLSVMVGEEGNTTAEVTCEQSEQNEITILAVVECVPVSTLESSRTSSLNEISTDIAKEARGSEERESDSDVEMVSSV